MIELKRVVKSYLEGETRHEVLMGVDLDVVRGEFVALVGRSGSGKTTLLNLLGGIDLPDDGEVWVGGVQLSDSSERERTLFRRRSVGFVFQSFNLLPTLTVLENVLLPLELSGAYPADAEARAEELLRRVDLLNRVESFPDRLSGGERQRVAIARALVHSPELVLADEPTGNLDRETGDRVLNLLRQLVEDEGTTLVMATHSRSAARLAGRVLAVDDGRLEKLGPG